MKLRYFTTAILGACVGAFAAPSFALEAMRCNVQTKPGLFQPALRIVNEGRSEDIRLGEDGLTRSVYYRDKEVLEYVSSKMGVPMALMPGSVSGQCSGTKASSDAQGGQGGGAVVAVTAPITAPAITEPVSVTEEPDITDYPEISDVPDIETTPVSEREAAL